ncbi:hypothetical protein [Brevundimonas aurantiaca]|jgi:hypothetical protein|uniref:hypothetical protein n=1 Tax=Brevundimonas aurantiaca TaxID=74316 RepID=UPI002FDD61A2
MSGGASIRVVPAVFKRTDSDEIQPVVRFVDPDNQDKATAEFFRVHVDHVECLIESIRRAQRDAIDGADLFVQASAEGRALLSARAGGQA